MKSRGSVVIAFGGFLAYLALSLLVGEWYPFTRLPMYSELTGYSSSQVLLCRMDGEEVACGSLHHVEGISVDRIRPLQGRPFSMGYRVQEIRSQMDRQGPRPEGDGSLFEVGFRPVEMGEAGPILGPFMAVEQGRAWRRP